MLSENQLHFFRENGYLVIEKVMSEDMLNRVQAPIERWVDRKVREWQQEGRLQDDFIHASFAKRLYLAWNAAGRPDYHPSPDEDIVSPEIFDLMRHPPCIQIARELMQTNNIVAHGHFHCRPKLPNQPFTDTPWHQDAQCLPLIAGSNGLVIWIPLMDVDETNSCLEMAPGHHKDGLYKKAKRGEVDYYIRMRDEDTLHLRRQAVPIKRGDVLCFNELTPHRALPNSSDAARWSVDIRFERVGLEHGVGLLKGFICSHDDPSQIETSYEHWKRAKWPNLA